MKARILLLAAGIASLLTSCSSLYKTGQTPDDVYYSPARPVVQEEYVQNDRNDRYNGYQSYEQYQDSYRNDRFLRLSMGNPYYTSVYDDYGWFDWRSNVYAGYWNSPWNNYWAWNNFYNPYAYCMSPYYGAYTYGKISFTEPKSKPIAFSRSSYSNRPTARYAPGSNGVYYNQGSAPRYNNSNSGYTQYNNNSSNSNSGGFHNSPAASSTPSRSYTPSSSSSSSSSGGGGGGGGISRPTRN